MRRHLFAPLLALTLSACTLVDPHADVPVAPHARPAVNPLTLYPETLRSFARGTTPAAVAGWWVQEHGIDAQVAEDTVQAWWQAWQQTGATPPPLPPVVAASREPPAPPAVASPPAAPPKGKSVKASTSPAERPEAIIQDAHQNARVAPTKRCYFGNTATCVFQYQPGRITDVYLTLSHATKITFPPGERLANALILDPALFEVQQFDVGDEAISSTVVMILPVTLSIPPTEVSLVTQTGRHYDLHLIVSKVGMLGVTWNLMPIPQMALDEPPLRAH